MIFKYLFILTINYVKYNIFIIIKLYNGKNYKYLNIKC